MIILELFSGFECISNAFRANGHKCFTVDWDTRFNSDLHKDISTLTLDDLPPEFRHPDIVFVGMDCTTYSVAAISTHRYKDDATGYLLPKSEKAIFADKMALHVQDLIKQMQPAVQIWENPRGGVAKSRIHAGFRILEHDNVLSIRFHIPESDRLFFEH